MRKYKLFVFFTVLFFIINSCLIYADTYNRVVSFFDEGQKFFKNENYEKALTNFKNAKILYGKSNQKQDLLYVKILRRIGDCYYYLGDYKKAIQLYESAIEQIDILLKKNGNKGILIHKAHLLVMLGNIFKIIDCNKAIPYYKEALNIYKKTDFKAGIGGCYLNLGNCFGETGQPDKAIEFTNKSIPYFNKNDCYSLSIAYSNLSDFYILKKGFENAISALEKSVFYSIKGNRKRQLLFNYIKLGKLRKEQQKYNEAINSFNKALELAQKTQDKEAIRKTLLVMADCYAKSGNYKEAYLCTLDFIKNSRELFSKQLVKQLAELENKHKAKVMKRKIETLKKISEKQQKYLFFHKTTLLISVVFIIIFIVLLWQRQNLIKDIERKNSDMKLLLQTIEKVSKSDDLTGLPNRRGLMEFIDREISRAERDGQSFCFAICDLDNFKLINDKFSHQVGDIILMAVSKTFQDLIRKIDIVARFGGEEFVFVFTGTSPGNARKVCEKIRKTIEETDFIVYETPIKVTVTFGITEFAPHKTFDKLLQEADKALYIGKENGKNRVVIYNQYLEK